MWLARRHNNELQQARTKRATMRWWWLKVKKNSNFENVLRCFFDSFIKLRFFLKIARLHVAIYECMLPIVVIDHEFVNSISSSRSVAARQAFYGFWFLKLMLMCSIELASYLDLNRENGAVYKTSWCPSFVQQQKQRRILANLHGWAEFFE